MTTIAVVGAGGVGGFFAARLADSGVPVSVIARGPHLESIRRDGLRVSSPQGDLHVRIAAVSTAGEVGPVDVVVFTVKSYDTESAAATLAPLLHANTVVVSFQNGVDNEERLIRRLGPQHVAGGVAFLFSELVGPGVVEHRGGPDRLLVGEFDGRKSERLAEFTSIATSAGFAAEVVGDIRSRLWSKFAFICAQAGMTAASRLSIGSIRADPTAASMFREIANEVTSLARAEGVPLPIDAVDQIVATASQLDESSRSSLHDDLVAGRRLELEALHGEVVRRADTAGVSAPANRAIYGILHPYLAVPPPTQSPSPSPPSTTRSP